MTQGIGFPFQVSPSGSITTSDDDDADIHGKIIQVLFTTPGERINQPTFGCGLFNMIFDANNSILAAAVEFTASQALTRWLGDEIAVSGVNVMAQDENLTVEIAYLRRRDAARQSFRVQFK
jgi:Bacteriophage baseplate protein W